LPPLLGAEADATADRAGWGLQRTAYGPDIVGEGRSARLATVDGRSITGQGQLEAAWTVAREALGTSAAPQDIEAADHLVFGGGALPNELAGWSAAVDFGDRDGVSGFVVGRALHGVGKREVRGSRQNPFGSILDARDRSGLVVTAEIATWDTTVFSIRASAKAGTGGAADPATERRRTAYAAVPRASLRRFLARLDRGELDGLFRRYLAAAESGRVLAGWAAALRPGLYDALAPVATFVAPDPRRPRLAGGSRAGGCSAAGRSSCSSSP
jgi:hypothetical protein